MTDTSIAAAHVATNDLRVGSVVRRSGAVLSRHFLPFFLVAAIAGSPTLLIASMQMIASMQTTEPIEPSEALSQDLWAMLGVGSHVIVPVLALAGPIAGLTGQLIWTGLTATFFGIIIAVTYYDLRVIKEGVDIEQITAVFE
jgi:hypothetical protein